MIVSVVERIREVRYSARYIFAFTRRNDRETNCECVFTVAVRNSRSANAKIRANRAIDLVRAQSLPENARASKTKEEITVSQFGASELACGAHCGPAERERNRKFISKE